MDPKIRAEMQQLMDMMKNYKNRLFLANHGKKRSVGDDSMIVQDESVSDDILTDEELSEIFAMPTGFFFQPKPIGRSFFKRGNPNGFNLPMMGKRGNPNGFNLPILGKRGNPNGFNLPILGGKRLDFYYSMPKRQFELDLDDEAGNFFGQRGKRYSTFSAARGRRANHDEIVEA